MISLRLHCIIFFLLGVALPLPSLNAGYVRPNTDVAFFENELLTLDKDQRSEVARELSAVTRNFPGSAATTPGVRARAMAVALMLDPTNREAVTSNGMFGNGLNSSKVEGYKSYKALVRDFERLARYLNGNDANEQDKRLGIMMADLVWRLAPQSEVGQGYQEVLDRGEGMDWTNLISPQVDQVEESKEDADEGVDPFGYLREEEDRAEESDGDNPEETIDLSGSEDGEDEMQKPDDGENSGVDESQGEEDTVKSLVREKLIAGAKPKARFVRVATMVSPPAMGYMSELTFLDMRVMSTRTTREWVDGERKRVENPVGADEDFSPYPEGQLASSEVYMLRVMDGMKNLQNEYQGWPKGCLAQVTSERYGGVSGSLGALATLVGVDALVRDLDIDPNVIVLGSFLPDSDMLTGHLELAPALLRFDKRLHSSVKRVVVPSAKADLYCNILAAVDSEIALHFQIIAVDSVREASELAQTSVGDPYKEAIAEFEKIQALEMRFDELIRNPHVQEKLASIIEKFPQHVSARVLLKASKMSPYGTLSEQESVDVLAAMIRPFAHMLEYELDAIAPSDAKAECQKFLDRLYKARRNTSRSVSGVVLTADEFIEDLLDFVSRNNRTTNSAMQKYDDAEEKFKALEAQFSKFNVELRW